MDQMYSALANVNRELNLTLDVTAIHCLMERTSLVQTVDTILAFREDRKPHNLTAAYVILDTDVATEDICMVFEDLDGVELWTESAHSEGGVIVLCGILFGNVGNRDVTLERNPLIDTVITGENSRSFRETEQCMPILCYRPEGRPNRNVLVEMRETVQTVLNDIHFNNTDFSPGVILHVSRMESWPRYLATIERESIPRSERGQLLFAFVIGLPGLKRDNFLYRQFLKKPSVVFVDASNRRGRPSLETKRRLQAEADRRYRSMYPPPLCRTRLVNNAPTDTLVCWLEHHPIFNRTDVQRFTEEFETYRNERQQADRDAMRNHAPTQPLVANLHNETIDRLRGMAAVLEPHGLALEHETLTIRTGDNRTIRTAEPSNALRRIRLQMLENLLLLSHLQAELTLFERERLRRELEHRFGAIFLQLTDEAFSRVERLSCLISVFLLDDHRRETDAVMRALRQAMHVDLRWLDVLIFFLLSPTQRVTFRARWLLVSDQLASLSRSTAHRRATHHPEPLTEDAQGAITLADKYVDLPLSRLLENLGFNR